MRRLYLGLASAALAAFSAGAAYYLLQDPSRGRRSDRIQVSSLPPERTVSPESLLIKPSAKTGEEADRGEADEEQGQALFLEDAVVSASLSGGDRQLPPAIDPEWQPGAMRTADAQAVTERAGFTMPLWSPVGLDIAFTKTDMASLWISGTQPGGGARMLSNDPGAGDGFGWNLDGMSLRARAPDGRFADVLITGERYPALERTARVFERDGRIFLHPEGDGEAVAVSGPEDEFHSPVLSPDETKVVFEGRETGIYMAAADGSRILRVGTGEQPSWLPDSSGIVYSRAVYDDEGPVDGDLWYASAEGRERTNITNSPGTLETHPNVSPDGQRIAYVNDGAVWVARLVRDAAP